MLLSIAWAHPNDGGTLHRREPHDDSSSPEAKDTGLALAVSFNLRVLYREWAIRIGTSSIENKSGRDTSRGERMQDIAMQRDKAAGVFEWVGAGSLEPSWLHTLTHCHHL